jgi:hypothetical protein
LLCSHSYDGKINICFTTDPGLVKDRQRFADILQEQFEELAEEVGVSIR